MGVIMGKHRDYHDDGPTGFFRGLCVAIPLGLALWAILWALYYVIMLPIVYTSYARGYCVEVDDVRGVYSCENLPRKYHHAWKP